jgi:sugar phosphate permease
MAQRFSEWRFAFYAPALGLLAVWVLFLIFQKNRPKDVGLPPVEEFYGDKKPVLKTKDNKKVTETEGIKSTIKAVIRNPMILRLGLVYFFLKPVRYAILFWGPVLVYEKLGTNIAGSAGISVMFEVAGPLGVFFAGYASDKFFNSRRMPMCVISFFLLSGVLFMFNTVTKSGSMVLMAAILFVIGFLLYGPDALISSVSAVDFGTKKGASSAAGVINGMGSTGQVLGMSLPGVISAHYGWGTVFYIFSGFILLAALILLPKWNAVPPENNE